MGQNCRPVPTGDGEGIASVHQRKPVGRDRQRIQTTEYARSLKNANIWPHVVLGMDTVLRTEVGRLVKFGQHFFVVRALQIKGSMEKGRVWGIRHGSKQHQPPSTCSLELTPRHNKLKVPFNTLPLPPPQNSSSHARWTITRSCLKLISSSGFRFLSPHIFRRSRKVSYRTRDERNS